MSGPAGRRGDDSVAAAFRAGDLRTLARGLTWVEDGDRRGRELLRRVHADGGTARVIGVTGSPGAGKSTLVDQIVSRLATTGRRVAVVAVDPSSAFSGGAILGDRIRMSDSSASDGVFIRSMATRGHVGGLARTTEDAIDLLDAFGFDDVIVETVGVGQDEVEIMQVAHANLLVLVPNMGDDVQAIKAGIMEIADAYVINKADTGGADRMEAHVRGMLQLYEEAPRDVPILRTVATRGEGVDELVDRLEDLVEAGRSRRGNSTEPRLRALLRDRLLERSLARPGARERLKALSERVVAREIDPHGAVGELMDGAPCVDHLGIAVRDVGEALTFWRDALGLEVGHEEVVASEDVRVTMLPVGTSRLELLEPLSEAGAVGRFLASRGPGVHHVCLRVADVGAAVERLEAAGVRIVGEAPRRGAGGALVAFVHPSSASGVLVELSEPGPSLGEGGGEDGA